MPQKKANEADSLLKTSSKEEEEAVLHDDESLSDHMNDPSTISQDTMPSRERAGSIEYLLL